MIAPWDEPIRSTAPDITPADDSRIRTADEQEARGRLVLRLLDEFDDEWAADTPHTHLIGGRQSARVDLAQYAADQFRRAAENRTKAAQ